MPLRADDTFSTFPLKKIKRPPYEEFLEINFQFYIESILHGKAMSIDSLMVSTSTHYLEGPGGFNTPN
jgi:hypothetical protein